MSNAKDLHNPIAHWISRLTKRRSPLEKDWALKSNYLLSNSCGKTQLSTQHSFPPFSNFYILDKGTLLPKTSFCTFVFVLFPPRFVLLFTNCTYCAPPIRYNSKLQKKKKKKKKKKKMQSSFYLLAFPGRFFLGENWVTVSMAFRAAETQRLTLPRSVRPCRTSHADPDTAAFRLRSFHWWSWSWHGDYCNYMNNVVSGCVSVVTARLW